MVRPVTTKLVAVGEIVELAVVQSVPFVEYCTSLFTASTPLVAGFAQETVAWAFPATTVTSVGGAGATIKF